MRASQVIAQSDVVSSNTKVAQVIAQADVVATKTKVAQVVAQTDVVASHVKVAQVIIQVDVVENLKCYRLEYTDAAAASDTIALTNLSAAIEESSAAQDVLDSNGFSKVDIAEQTAASDILSSLAEFGVVISEVGAASDVTVGSNYSQYQRLIDKPVVGPIRIAKIELSGVTLYLCDRIWGSN